MARKTSKRKSTRRAGHNALFPNSPRKWFWQRSASDQTAQQQGATQDAILLEVFERVAGHALRVAKNYLNHAESHEEYGRLSKAWSDALQAEGWIGQALGPIMSASYFKNRGGQIGHSEKLESITEEINDVGLALWHLTNRLREKTFGVDRSAEED